MAVLNTYPPLNTHFVVDFHNNKYGLDHKFQSVDGLSVKLVKDDTRKEPIAQFQDIVLKRAYEPNSKLLAWCMDTINNKKYVHENFTVKLLDAKHEVISAWVIEQALPIGWNIEELHAQDTKILIETITFKYSYFQILNSKGQKISPKN
ncbi:phage tail protein [Zobellia roscoffensis]|uniref:phage tail protein n=1 Tax=Zobellia roscoffensis TaxID=2779508 RepID=UPI00188D40B2|nr:phage tail protein [Zobellia roscoffensis]